MFTGIVQGIGRVLQVEKLPGLSKLQIELPSGCEENLRHGASIAIDGVCLTVAQFQGRSVVFDVMQESLSLTTLGALEAGGSVNVERAATADAEIGGHPISGHIDTRARVSNILSPQNNHVIRFEVDRPWIKYIFSKGFIGLNGASLTVTNVDKAACSFEVWLIPETLKLTTFGTIKIGDLVNLEIDRSTQVLVDTVREFLHERFGPDSGPPMQNDKFE